MIELVKKKYFIYICKLHNIYVLAAASSFDPTRQKDLLPQAKKKLLYYSKQITCLGSLNSVYIFNSVYIIYIQIVCIISRINKAIIN